MQTCDCCREVVEHRIRVPSNTAYWFCYDCFSYWMEGYDSDYLVTRMIKHWRDKAYKEQSK